MKEVGAVFTIADSMNLLLGLQRETVAIHSVYTVQRQLFGSGPDNVGLLNRSGSNVFAYFQLLANQYIVSKLSAMTDDKCVAGRATLSTKRLRYVLRLIPDNQHLLTLEFLKKFDELANDLGKKVRPIRKFRHKHVAHLDLGQTQTAELVPLTDGQIEEALASMCKLLNHVEHAVMGGLRTNYAEMRLPSGSDGNRLLELLRVADKR